MSLVAHRMKLWAMLANDHGPKDEEHRQLYEKLVDRITQVVEDPVFAPIHASWWETGIDWRDEEMP